MPLQSPTQETSLRSLADADGRATLAELDWEAALVWVDDRFDYAELRMIALAPKTETLYYVAFVDRGDARRIISLRRANRREVKHYVESI